VLVRQSANRFLRDFFLQITRPATEWSSVKKKTVTRVNNQIGRSLSLTSPVRLIVFIEKIWLIGQKVEDSGNEAGQFEKHKKKMSKAPDVKPLKPVPKSPHDSKRMQTFPPSFERRRR
jgi:hypothetical protein